MIPRGSKITTGSVRAYLEANENATLQTFLDQLKLVDTLAESLAFRKKMYYNINLDVIKITRPRAGATDGWLAMEDDATPTGRVFSTYERAMRHVTNKRHLVFPLIHEEMETDHPELPVPGLTVSCDYDRGGQPMGTYGGKRFLLAPPNYLLIAEYVEGPNQGKKAWSSSEIIRAYWTKR